MIFVGVDDDGDCRGHCWRDDGGDCKTARLLREK